MNKILETPRLYLREFTIEDAQSLIDLNSKPNVIRYTGDGPVKELAEAKRILTDIIFPQYKNKIHPGRRHTLEVIWNEIQNPT